MKHTYPIYEIDDNSFKFDIPWNSCNIFNKSYCKYNASQKQNIENQSQSANLYIIHFDV